MLDGDTKVADVVFDTIHDRKGRTILSVRDQNNHDTSLRRKRLMMMLHLFLIHRYDADSIHYVAPTDDNHRLASTWPRWASTARSATRWATSSCPTLMPATPSSTTAKPASSL